MGAGVILLKLFSTEVKYLAERKASVHVRMQRMILIMIMSSHTFTTIFKMTHLWVIRLSPNWSNRFGDNPSTLGSSGPAYSALSGFPLPRVLFVESESGCCNRLIL